MNRLLTAGVIALLPLGIGVPAYAAPSAHDVLVEAYDAFDHFDAGAAEPCVPWAGIFHEVRSGEIKLVTIGSGTQVGEVHVNGVIAGLVEYIPDNPTQPTYSGSYREKLDGVLLTPSFDDDQERISQFRLRSRLAGTDGTNLLLAMSGKVTRHRDGTVVVDRFDFTCE